MALALILPERMMDAWEQRFHDAAPDLIIRRWPQAKGAADIRYAYCWNAPQGALAAFPNLEVIFSFGAGVDHILRDPSVPNLPIVRIVDDNLTMRMGEYVLLHVLLHHRRLAELLASQKQRVWLDFEQHAANAMRVGVMGLGELGGSVAQKLAMVGFQVSGWSRTKRALDGIATYAGAAELDPFLACTDILVVLLPLTPDTRGVLNKALLSKLAKDGPLGGPVLINAGRGGLQIEADIVEALDAGMLHAASLDVFNVEPLPEDSPLWAHPKVIITPHNAADSEPDALCRYVLGVIADYEAGRPLRNLVDRKRGY